MEIFNEAYPDGDVEGATEMLKAFNSLGCPLGPPPGPPPFAPPAPGSSTASPGKPGDASGRDAPATDAPPHDALVGPEMCTAGMAATVPLMILGWGWIRRRQNAAG